MAVSLKMTAIWDIALYSLIVVDLWDIEPCSLKVDFKNTT
jgi:hypothetical protein